MINIALFGKTMQYSIAMLKILLPSIALSYLIKYLAPLYPLSPTPINVAIGIFTPTIVVAAILGFKSRKITGI
jgi:hypothetical protein